VLYEDLMDFLDECEMPVPDELKPEAISILLVDDDEHYLRTLRKALLRADKTLQITTCSSGLDALLSIGSQKPNVVLLDSTIQGLDGVEVCQRIKKNRQTQDVMVIANSEHPSPSLEKKMTRAGAAAMLVKPFKSTALMELIKPGRG